jgi:hypothetical protein
LTHVTKKKDIVLLKPRSWCQIIFKQGERDMGDKGKKIKAKGNNKKGPA